MTNCFKTLSLKHCMIVSVFRLLCTLHPSLSVLWGAVAGVRPWLSVWLVVWSVTLSAAVGKRPPAVWRAALRTPALPCWIVGYWRTVASLQTVWRSVWNAAPSVSRPKRHSLQNDIKCSKDCKRWIYILLFIPHFVFIQYENELAASINVGLFCTRLLSEALNLWSVLFFSLLCLNCESLLCLLENWPIVLVRNSLSLLKFCLVTLVAQKWHTSSLTVKSKSVSLLHLH